MNSFTLPKSTQEKQQQQTKETGQGEPSQSKTTDPEPEPATTRVMTKGDGQQREGNYHPNAHAYSMDFNAYR